MGARVDVGEEALVLACRGWLDRVGSALLVAALWGAIALAGCDTNRHVDIDAAEGMAAPERSDATSAPSSRLSHDEVSRLKALGYVDIAEGPADGTATGVVLRDSTRSQPGYDLFTNAFTCSTEIVDAAGRAVHRWSREPCFRWDNRLEAPFVERLLAGRTAPARLAAVGR